MRILGAFCVLSALTVASFEAKAQDFTSVKVNLPYTVTVWEQQLQPGEYTIRPIDEASGIFAVYKDGIDFETLVHAIPAEKLDPATRSELVLRSDGQEYSLDQMWIAGLNRGFQFLSPESARSRQREKRISEISAIVVR
jgi:hypothetical protein